MNLLGLADKHGLCMVIPYVTVKQKTKNIWNKLKRSMILYSIIKTCLKI